MDKWKWIVLAVILILGALSAYYQHGKKNIKGIIWSIVGALAMGILVNYVSPLIIAYLPDINPPALSSYDDSKNDVSVETSETSEVIDDIPDSEDKPQDTEEIDDSQLSDLSTPDTSPAPSNDTPNSTPPKNDDDSVETDNTDNYINQLVDITAANSASGSLTESGQKDCYRYTALIGGTYRFSTDRSAGGAARVRISGENNRSIDSGTNALTIDLEQGKTYILSIEYQNDPCDYTVNIGVPVPLSDISGETSVSGQITFQDQKNRYYYTAPVSGTYRFDANLSAGGQVRVRISGENGNSIDYGTNALTIDLEAGKTYILGIEYRNGPCDYVVSIGVPIPITDITGYGSVSGNITYQDQKDRYYYTAPVSGTYCFNSNLSAGGEVRIRVSGENGASLNYGTNTLKMNLEAGKTYILSVEHRNTPCSYTVLLELQ